jgi:hypothetical protein
MDRKRTLKLSLNRETMKRLDPEELVRAHGAQEDGLFGSFLCGSKKCKSKGDAPTCLGQTCMSCNGPNSCAGPCITTEPY